MKLLAMLNVLATLVLVTGLARAGEPAADALRDEAQLATQKYLAQRQVRNLEKFRMKTLFPVTRKVFNKGIKTCRAAGLPPTADILVYMLILNSDGSVAKVLGVRETPFHKCLTEAIEQAKYPAPPRAPFYELLSGTP